MSVELKDITFQPGLTNLSGDIFTEDIHYGASKLYSTFECADQGCMEPVLEWLRGNPVKSHKLGRLKESDLRHELSIYTESASSDVFMDGRSLCEMDIINQAYFPGELLDYSFGDFCEWLVYLNGLIVSDQVGLRTSEVRTVSDKRGNCVKYPSPCHVIPRLRCIHGFLITYFWAEPGLAAVVTMASLTNLHPFVDGNGRLARVLFNWLMSRKLGKEIYLPIYEISALSYGGYLIRLKQALYHSNWAPLVGLLSACANRLFGGTPSGVA